MDKRQAVIEEIPGLRRFARALCGNQTLADDLVQDCLERALGKLHLWQQNTNMRAWLFTILRNIYINQLRSSARRPNEYSYDEQQEMMAGTAPTQGQGLFLRDLESALNMLPEQQREVIILIGVEGVNYKDASQILGIPIGTVMSRLSRGRHTLKSLMDGDHKGGKPALRSVK